MSGPDVSADTPAAHWERKARELAYLRTFAGDHAGPETPVRGFADYFAAVQSARRALRVHQAERSAHLFETALVGPDVPRFDIGGTSIAYNYQRYNLARVGIDWLTTLHGRQAPGHAVRGWFVGSGMAGIASVMAALVAMGHTRMSMSPLTYFETYQLIRNFFPAMAIDTAVGPRHGNDADLLWLDSASTAWPELPQERGAVRTIVVDTTCVEADSELVGRWIEEAARLGCPLILIRSHLKLDTFGVELGRLGSVLIIAPGQDPETIAPLELTVRRAIAAFGSTFEIPNLYPWLGDAEFFALSRRRTDGIRAVTAALADAVEAARRPADTYTLVRPPHGLFFIVLTDIPFAEPDAWMAHELCDALARRAVDAGLPAFSGSSFGLDRVSFLEFMELRNDLHHLRIAGADLPMADVLPLAAHIRDAIAEMSGR